MPQVNEVSWVITSVSVVIIIMTVTTAISIVSSATIRKSDKVEITTINFIV